MSREEYIERLVRLFKLRYKPDEFEIECFRLALDAMPNKGLPNPFSPIIDIPDIRPWDNKPLMYGPVYPEYMIDGIKEK